MTTLPDGEYTATVDRIVDGETAVVLIEAEGDVVDQIDLPVERTPSGCEAGSVVSVTVTDGELTDIVTRPDQTKDRRERIEEKLGRLSRRLDDSDPDSDSE